MSLVGESIKSGIHLLSKDILKVGKVLNELALSMYWGFYSHGVSVYELDIPCHLNAKCSKSARIYFKNTLVVVYKLDDSSSR